MVRMYAIPVHVLGEGEREREREGEREGRERERIAEQPVADRNYIGIGTRTEERGWGALIVKCVRVGESECVRV